MNDNRESSTIAPILMARMRELPNVLLSVCSGDRLTDDSIVFIIDSHIWLMLFSTLHVTIRKVQTIAPECLVTEG